MESGRESKLKKGIRRKGEDGKGEEGYQYDDGKGE